MLADLDLLLTAVFCTADDLLPEKEKNARRSLTDAEVATLCVVRRSLTSPLIAIPGGRRKTAREAVSALPRQPGFHKRRY